MGRIHPLSEVILLGQLYALRLLNLARISHWSEQIAAAQPCHICQLLSILEVCRHPCLYLEDAEVHHKEP